MILWYLGLLLSQEICSCLLLLLGKKTEGKTNLYFSAPMSDVVHSKRWAGCVFIFHSPIRSLYMHAIGQHSTVVCSLSSLVICAPYAYVVCSWICSKWCLPFGTIGWAGRVQTYAITWRSASAISWRLGNPQCFSCLPMKSLKSIYGSPDRFTCCSWPELEVGGSGRRGGPRRDGDRGATSRWS